MARYHIWALVDPVPLFDVQPAALFQGVVTNEAVTLVVLGLLALVIAGFCYKRHRAIQIAIGSVLGAGLIKSPWLFGFSGNVVAAWYTGLIGLGVLVTTLFALVKSQTELSSW